MKYTQGSISHNWPFRRSHFVQFLTVEITVVVHRFLPIKCDSPLPNFFSGKLCKKSSAQGTSGYNVQLRIRPQVYA
jgi:hypothetical protein